MIDKIIFDTDGVVIQREMYFSARLSKDFGVDPAKVLPFFKKEFHSCLTGKTDTKVELNKYLPLWNWAGSVDELLEYWFKHESAIDARIVQKVKSLTTSGVHCYLDTNNEKYRTEYLSSILGLNQIFERIFSSSTLGYAKPAIEFWSAIYDQLNQPEKSTILVWDDEEETIQSAREFGFEAELYTGFEAFEKVMRSRIS